MSVRYWYRKWRHTAGAHRYWRSDIVWYCAGVQRWTAEARNGDDVALEYNARVQHIGVSAAGPDPVYFVAPSLHSRLSSLLFDLFISSVSCVQCFDAVGWAAGRASGLWKLSGGVLAWLSVWSEVQTCMWPSWCHCHSLSLASVKSRLVLLFWYRLTWEVRTNGR